MPALGLPPLDPAFEMSVASTGMSQGLRLTDGGQIFPRVSLRSGVVRIGAQWRNVSSAQAGGVAAIFVGYVREIGRFTVEADVRDRLKTGVKGSATAQAWEFGLGGRARFGKVGARMLAEYSPDEFGRGLSLYAEAGATLDIGKSTRLLANLGRRERAGAPDYRSMSLGLSRSVAKGLALDLRLYTTDRGELGANYRPRVVLAARIQL